MLARRGRGHLREVWPGPLQGCHVIVAGMLASLLSRNHSTCPDWNGIDNKSQSKLSAEKEELLPLKLPLVTVAAGEVSPISSCQVVKEALPSHGLARTLGEASSNTSIPRSFLPPFLSNECLMRQQPNLFINHIGLQELNAGPLTGQSISMHSNYGCFVSGAFFSFSSISCCLQPHQ